MIIKEYDRRINIFPFEPERRESETEEDFQRRIAVAGNVSVCTGNGENLGKISCNFTLPDVSLTLEDFCGLAGKLNEAFEKAIAISGKLQATAKSKAGLKAGWIEHPGTYCAHYFRAGITFSLCRLAHRDETHEVFAERESHKCSICEKSVNEPRAGYLF